VLLIIGLLGCGLIGLLLLNTATASASFREQSLQDRNTALTLQQQDLQREVSALDAPQALAKAAAKLGMVPGPDPAFLELFKNGTSKVIGDPNPVSAPVPPPPPPTSPAPATTHAPKKTTQKKVSSKPTSTGHPTAGHTTEQRTTGQPTTDQHTTSQHSPVPQHRQTHGGH
jgi:type II secretory pathway pseudopilin PulG